VAQVVHDALSDAVVEIRLQHAEQRPRQHRREDQRRIEVDEMGVAVAGGDVVDDAGEEQRRREPDQCRRGHGDEEAGDGPAVRPEDARDADEDLARTTARARTLAGERVPGPTRAAAASPHVHRYIVTHAPVASARLLETCDAAAVPAQAAATAMA